MQINGEICKNTKLQEIHREQMQAFYERLKAHDWFYAYSDDGRVYRAGEAERSVIRQRAKDIGRDAERLYRAFYDMHYGPHSGFTYRYEDANATTED